MKEIWKFRLDGMNEHIFVEKGNLEKYLEEVERAGGLKNRTIMEIKLQEVC